MPLSDKEQRHMYDAVIRIEEEIKTIKKRGCEVGHVMVEKMRKDLEAKIDKQNRYARGIGIFGILVGAIAVYFFKK